MKKSVLIIEDNKDICESIAELLSMEGYHVMEAASGEFALQLIDEHHPDAIVCDIVLSGIDGYEIFRRLKQQGLNIPFIFSSARSEKSDLQKAKDLGVKHYMIKPFDEAELIRLIKEMVM